MTATQNHIIYKVFTRVEFTHKQEDFFLQNKVASVVKEKLIPAIESLFDESISPSKKIKIKSLKIDVGNIKNEGWEDKLLTQTLAHIKQKINEVISFNSKDEVYEIIYDNQTPVINKIQSTDELIDNLIDFLRNGLLAWNTVMLTAKSLLNSLIEISENKKISGEQKEKLLNDIFYSDKTLNRLLQQFTDSELLNFFDKVLQFKNIRELFKLYAAPFSDNAEAHEQKIIKWITLLNHFKSEIKNINVLTVVLKKNVIETALSKNKTKKPNNLTPGKLLNNKEYFINNAGLILIANFFQQLFINLGLSDKKQFLSLEKQKRAVLLTQYLLTCQNEIAEQDLLLNKILCDYPLSETLPSVLIPTNEEQQQCKELLQSVLEYWKELKTNNIQSFCNTFLLRNGKLTEQNDYWLLQVEYKAYDVLLNFLPWSISVIFLPWMAKKIVVEWHS